MKHKGTLGVIGEEQKELWIGGECTNVDIILRIGVEENFVFLATRVIYRGKSVLRVHS